MDEEIKERSKQEIDFFLQEWRDRREIRNRRKRYRLTLCLLIFLSVFALAGMEYYRIRQSIPSVIRICAGKEQTFDLGIPAKGTIVSVAGRNVSNIPKEQITVDFGKKVTLKAENLENYFLKVNLFGFFPLKKVDIQVIQDQELIPVGVPIGVYVKTDGVLVIGTGEFQGEGGVTYSPAKYILKSGDYIQKVNGTAVSTKKELIQYIEANGRKKMTLTVKREEEQLELEVTPERNEEGLCKLGIWIRDNAQGVGTMTYMDENGNFGALGHGINDVDTSTLMNTNDGTLYRTEIVSIKKGRSGEPGEMTGMIIYTPDRILGDITSNSEKGIFGTCNEKALGLTDEDPIPIGLKTEIEKGPAQILCAVNGTPAYYDVEITAVHMNQDNINRGIELKVTDKQLLKLAGGIVQGMSGSPIVQNGKIIGAVTHVFVNDPAKGYGIFIENMLSH